MPVRLDVLVVESHPGAADLATRHLEDAGHTVHRCFGPDDRGFPCRGVVSSDQCPMSGKIDVALVVRRRVTPRPTRLEDGATCAIRTGVPIVEEGPEILDPFAPYLARRVRHGDDVARACEATAAAGYEPFASDVVARVGRLFEAAGIQPGDVRCRVEPNGTSTDIHLEVPVPVSRSFEHALGVRVLDAVRSSGRTLGHVDVHVHHPADEDHT